MVVWCLWDPLCSIPVSFDLDSVAPSSHMLTSVPGSQFNSCRTIESRTSGIGPDTTGIGTTGCGATGSDATGSSTTESGFGGGN